MKSFFEHAPCIYFAASDDGVLLEVNDSLCTTLEYEAAALVGKKIEVLLTIPSRIFQQTHFFPLLKIQGHAEEIFLTLQNSRQEQLPVLINAQRKEIDGSPVSLYTGIIVHNRKKFEDELIAARKAAEATLHENTALEAAKGELEKHIEVLDKQIHLANKQNHELRQINYVVSHNMQEPIRKLLLFTGMLQQQKEKGNQQELTGKIGKVAEDMRMVLSDVQKFVWLQEAATEKRMIDLNRLLEEQVKRLQNEFAEIELHIDEAELPAISGDPSQVQLLFYHVLANAIRFRKEPGIAYVTISGTELKLNQFRHVEGKYKYSDFLRVQVRDEGIGFESVYRENVFELFKRLHTESGRGVGLALCKKIVDNHYGNIRIDSAPGEGATVTIDWPLNLMKSVAMA